MSRRILLLITDLQIGGSPTVVRELAIRLNAIDGVTCDVACLSTWGPTADQLRDAGVQVSALDARGAHDLPRTISRFVKLVREQQYDTVMSFLIHANIIAAMGKPFLPTTRFFQSIQTTQPTPRWHWTAQRIVAEAAEMFVVPSEAVKRVAMAWADIDAAKIVVVPNAVELAEYDSARFAAGAQLRAFPDEEKRAELRSSGETEESSAPRTVRIGFIGRLDPIKRVPLLIRAMKHLPTDWRLDIFGEGADRAMIERAIADDGLTDRVTLHGVIPKPQSALATIDVLALPSLAEGFGLVLIEAMAAGVPVVAADSPGIRDVVQHGVNGLLVDVTDSAAFAKALQHACAEQKGTLIAGGMETVREHYDWAAVLPMYRRVFEL